MPDEEERPPTGVDAGLVEGRSQLTPGRKRQRLPVQLWGQLLRPCRVLGAATDSGSLQRRCSAAMTRCGPGRLAAGATRSSLSVLSTPADIHIQNAESGRQILPAQAEFVDQVLGVHWSAAPL
jgi:hypothetical protein